LCRYFELGFVSTLASSAASFFLALTSCTCLSFCSVWVSDVLYPHSHRYRRALFDSSSGYDHARRVPKVVSFSVLASPREKSRNGVEEENKNIISATVAVVVVLLRLPLCIKCPYCILRWLFAKMFLPFSSR